MKTVSSPSRFGFSLIELLFVIAVLVILLALVAPAFNALGKASHLTNSANLVTDELNFARQTALSRNRIVEVRFYLLRDEIGTATAYRAFRSFIADDSGKNFFPLDPLRRFPPSVIASSEDQFSTLLGETLRPATADQVENLPGATGTKYKALRFSGLGRADLTAYASNNDMWFLTLKNENDTSTTQRSANNFATIQVDPATGRSRQFRP